MEALARFETGVLAAEPEEPTLRVIVFRSCDEWFALPIEAVREVQPLGRVVGVPTAPPEVLGVMNLRGRALALFDLGGCLGIHRGTRPVSHTVVLDFGDSDLHVGLAVQQIGQVRRVPVSAVGPPPPREGVSGCLEGVFEVEGQVIGLLDLLRVFARFLPEWGVSLEPRGNREPALR
jgi:chemotaxis signal transduction protein